MNPDKDQQGGYWLTADYSDAPITARYVKLAMATAVYGYQAKAYFN